MHDIRLIRERFGEFQHELAKRGAPIEVIKLLIADANVREFRRDLEILQADKKKIQLEFHSKKQTIEKVKAEGGPLREIIDTGKYSPQQLQRFSQVASDLHALNDEQEQLLAKSQTNKFKLEVIESGFDRAKAELDAILTSLPNLPAPEVPDGADETGNVEVSRWGAPRAFAFAPREHADLGPPLGLDFETAAAIAGSRFAFLRGQMARLQRALGQFMLDRQVAAGFTECAPPLLVRDEAMFGTGQLPKFAEESFKTTDGRWLIPTAEVSLTNAVRERILNADELPIRMTALTPCFRSEAGAAGKDTRGMIRQHQFDKVELVTICRPEDSEAEHEALTRAAESVLEALDLPYRRMLLCAGDMGFSARKTFDLEVWLPGQGAWREISSCSNCGDFQARRMNARFRREGQKGTEFVHTLNGSGLAVGRTLVAVLESFQQEDGSVTIPPALLPYMGGITQLTAN